MPANTLRNPQRWPRSDSTPAASTAAEWFMRCLLNDFQRGFPLVERPFAALAQRLGTTENAVLAALRAALAAGAISRVGAVFKPGSVGVSTLAAIAVPPPRLAAVAALVSAHREVNHNYQRENDLNLWFVATAADDERLARVLTAIERETGLAVISLPMIADYHIDLGFDLVQRGAKPIVPPSSLREPSMPPLDAGDWALVAALQDGMPLVRRPFAALAVSAGWRGANAGTAVCDRIGDWIRRGTIKRFGVIVRHRELGYVANAMCVWDVPAAHADRIGRALAREPAVTLCYQRAHAGAVWPYNLYCMIHGHDRVAVEAELATLSQRHALAAYPHTVLFSCRAFKQRGAHYAIASETVDG